MNPFIGIGSTVASLCSSEIISAEAIRRVKASEKNRRTTGKLRADQEEETIIALSQAAIMLGSHSNVIDYGPELEVPPEDGQVPV